MIVSFCVLLDFWLNQVFLHVFVCSAQNLPLVPHRPVFTALITQSAGKLTHFKFVQQLNFTVTYLR